MTSPPDSFIREQQDQAVNSALQRYCLDCAYSLIGLPENRCPECGREFDPADPRTFLKQLPGTWTKRLGEAVCDLEGASAWVFAAMVAAAIIASAVGELFPLAYLPVLVGVMYLPLVCTALLFRLAGVCPVSGTRLARGPILCVIAATVAFSDWPLRLTFACSRGSLERLAAQIGAGQSPELPVRAGLFVVRGTENRNGIICLWTDPDPAGPGGFANCAPAGAARNFNINENVFLSGQWQWIVED